MAVSILDLQHDNAVPLAPVKDFALRVSGRRRETRDIVTFEFEPDAEGRRLRHLPGQALALTLPTPGGPATRSFTIASSGLEPRHLCVTMKAGRHGGATHWAHEALQVGDCLSARGPFGRFSLAYEPRKPLALIGAGSGFTPMMSMLRWLHARREAADVVILQVARSAADILFDAELAAIDRDLPNIARFDCVTAPAAGENWRGFRGRPDRAMMRAMIPDLGRRAVFCCGPEGFMRGIEATFRAEGGAVGSFYTESFSVYMQRPALKATVGPGGGHMAHFRGKSFAAAPDVSIAQAAAAAHIRIPTGCGAGQCGTCKLRLLEGEVEMRHQGGLSVREEAEGYILACCSQARSSLVLADLA